MSDAREQLEAVIASLKCLRTYYEDELPVYEYSFESHLSHPGDMLNHIHRAIDPLHRALRGVNHEAAKAREVDAAVPGPDDA